MLNRFSEYNFHAKTFAECPVHKEADAKIGVVKALSINGPNKLVITGLDNIASETGCSKKTLYKWIRQRSFPAFKMDGIWRAMPKDIECWFEEVNHKISAR